MTATTRRVKEGKEISAFDRLRQLPPVFRATDVALRFDWDSKKTSHYLWLWKQRDLIEGLGGKSDVFANTFLHPEVNWEEALLLATPSAVVIGLEALRRAGWVTQVPVPPHIAIAPVDTLYALHPRDDRGADKTEAGASQAPGHFALERRSLTWYAAVRRHGILPSGSARLVPALHPAWALADLLVTRGWGQAGITPSDVQWDVATARDRAQWSRAAIALQVRPELISVDEAAVEALSPQG